MNTLALVCDPRFLLATILALIIGGLGGHFKGAEDERAAQAVKTAIAVSSALDGERALRSVSDQWTSDYINRLTKQKEKSDALPQISLVNDCAVPAAVGSLLNNAQRLFSNAGSGPDIGAAGQTVDSTCAAELEIAKRNYADVCTPNAEQLTELQQRYEKIKKAVNANLQKAAIE